MGEGKGVFSWTDGKVRWLASVAACSSVALIFVLVAGAQAPAAPGSAPEVLDRSGRPVLDGAEPHDLYGRPIYDAAGDRRNYTREETAHLSPIPRDKARAVRPAIVPVKNTMTIGLEWHRSIYGVGIGDTGLSAADLDGDGGLEIVAGAGPRASFDNDFWYVLRHDGSGYPQLWARHQYSDDIGSLTTVDIDEDGDAEVLVGVGSDIEIYDGLDPVLTQTVSTAAAEIRGLTAVDVDDDDHIDLVFCDANNLYIYDLATGTQEYAGAGYGCVDLAVGQVADDPDWEIVIANGTGTGWVLDGVTQAVKWTHAGGFGDHVDLGDFDGDGLQEIVAAFRWNDIDVYDADTQTFAYTLPVSGELATMKVLDVDGDGPLEIVYGDGQWGSIHVHDGATGALDWSRSNPDHGVTDLEVADVDGDGTSELLWGAGFSSSGADYLYVVDTVSLVQEWQSQDVTGPFRALDYGDLDGDAGGELVIGCFESESGYADGLYFVYDAATRVSEYSSGEPTGSDFNGLWRVRQANVDADTQNELFVTTSSGYSGMIIAYDGLTHAEEWQLTIESGLSFQGLAVADVDGDGNLELAASTGREHTGASGVYLYVFDAASGALEWQSPSLGANFVDFPLLRVADVDGDAALELLVGRRGGELQVFDGVSHVQELITADLDLSALDTPDRDGDGTAEILIGTEAGSLEVLDPATGTVVETVGSHGGQIDGLAAADVNGDGTAEYVFGLADEVRVQDGATGTVVWSSGDIGNAVGDQDSLRVADVDGDGNLEIFVNLGEVGVRLYQVDLTDPEVAINTPAGGSAFLAGEPISFDGSASDVEDGDLTASLSWSSDLDGAIGSGGSFQAGLSAGSHLVTASVTDSGGLEGSAQVDLLIHPNTPPAVSIIDPEPDTQLIETEAASFEGSASDAEEGDLSASLSWTSDLDGVIGSGGSFSLTTLSIGTHVITAAVTDVGGLVGSDAVTVIVNANTDPVVTLTAPADGSSSIETDPVTFTGSASDAEDGDLTAGLSWTSDLDGAIGSGGSFVLTTLSIGTHLITASVTDSHGGVDSANVTITVDANTAPAATIASPADASSSVETDPVTFTGLASDAQDGDLTAGLSWTSSLDGAIGSGGSFSLTTLSVGTHVITASVTDSHGAPGSDSVTITVDPNTPPAVTITSPADASSSIETDPVSFVGSANDAQDGDLTANLSWTSSLDGAIGSGGSFVLTTLSIGTHVITASVTDSHGAQGSDNVTITVNANTPPSVTITGPADGTMVTVGDLVTFTGVASDLEDGDISGNLAWSSDLDGAIGVGASVATSSLSQGVHLITAAVVDSHGLGDSDAIGLRVLSLPVEIILSSIGLDDGRIEESSESSGVGGKIDSTADNNRALRVGDARKDKQLKTIVSFDTSQVPDGAVIASADLRLRRGRVQGTNPFSTHGACRVDAQTGGFGGDVALAASDFQAAATAVAVTTLSDAPSNGDWSEGTLDAAGLAAIDVAGTTQLRVYFDLDDNDDNGNDYIGYYSGDDGNPGNRPQLVVTYQE